jgi:putative ABC transport system permease protein
MRAPDILRLAGGTVTRSPMRSVMVLLAMAIGVAAVVVLTSLGEAARRYVTGEFTSLGTNLIIVLPGRSETTGGAAALVAGQTPRDLTIADAMALARSPAIDQIAPVVIGSAGVQWGGREREAPVLGSTAELLTVRHWVMDRGLFLPSGDPERASNVVVLGKKLRDELFRGQPAVGQWLRVGDRRLRVIGILGTEGRTIGIDSQELAIIPVASALAMFDTASLFRIILSARSREDMKPAQDDVRRIIAARHQGEEDITVITQDAVLATFDRIFQALTMTLGGIAAISLVVAGILIMNVMLVSVSQRTGEIGLLKALGAPRRRIIMLFVAEAILLSLIGAVAGLAVGHVGSWAIGQMYPDLPVGAPLWAVIAATVTAVASGLVFGILPARRAADLNPVEALARR